MDFFNSAGPTTINNTIFDGALPMSFGFTLISRISSISGSPTLSYIQPLVNRRLCFAPWILLGAQALLLLAKRVFRLENLPVLDMSRGQLLEIPIGELQNLLQYLAARQIPSSLNQGVQSPTSPITFPTELPAESPLFIAIYVSVDYSEELYTPYLLAYLPILSFPGLRGGLPFIILALLAVIFIRCVVPPETTGAKPAPKPSIRKNQAINLMPEDVIAILRRFGRYFGSS